MARRCGAKRVSKSKPVKHSTFGEHFWQLRRWKNACDCGAKRVLKSKCPENLGPLLPVERRKCALRCGAELNAKNTTSSDSTFNCAFYCFFLADARDSAPCRKWAKHEAFVAVAKGFEEGRSAKMDFALQAQCNRHLMTSPSEMSGVRALMSWERLHFGASDLQVCYDDFAWHVQHFVWSGFTFWWQAQYFKDIAWKKCKTRWYEAISSALNFPFWKELSQICFVFDDVTFKNWGSLAYCIVLEVATFMFKESSSLFRFGAVLLQFFDPISQNCFFLDRQTCR